MHAAGLNDLPGDLHVFQQKGELVAGLEAASKTL